MSLLAERPAAQRGHAERSARAQRRLDLNKSQIPQCAACPVGTTCSAAPCSAPRPEDWSVLPAGRVRPARTRCGLLVRGSPIAVATDCGGSYLWLGAPCICWRVGGTCDISVEALLPEGRERFELGSSGWPRVLGIDAVGGPPHCDFADEGCLGWLPGGSPDWLGVTLAGVVLDLVGEVGD